jgi:predicted nucleic acid-binding protein
VTEIFVDSDIILDLLMHRLPHGEAAESLFKRIEMGDIRAYTSPIIFANLHYLIKRLAPERDVTQTLKKLRLLTSVLPVDETTIDLALQSGLKDFDDAIQYFTALRHGLPFLITRNVKDYPKDNKDIQIYTAEEFLLLML